MSCSVRRTTRHRFIFIYPHHQKYYILCELSNNCDFLQTKYCQDIKISCLFYFNSFLNICTYIRDKENAAKRMFTER